MLNLTYHKMCDMVTKTHFNLQGKLVENHTHLQTTFCFV
jgi:hypothetical protein